MDSDNNNITIAVESPVLIDSRTMDNNNNYEKTLVQCYSFYRGARGPNLIRTLTLADPRTRYKCKLALIVVDRVRIL